MTRDIAATNLGWMLSCSGVHPAAVRIVEAHEAEIERLREEYKRLAWCHLGVERPCPACLGRARALGLAP